MEFSPTPVFYAFIGLMIGMVIGWVIGFFDSNGRTSKKIEAADVKMKEAERKIAEAEQNFQPSPAQQYDPALLSLKKNDGRFTLEMDGAPVTGELPPDRKKRLIELITVMRPWFDGGQSSPAISQPAAPVQLQPTSEPARDMLPRPAQSSAQPIPAAKKPEAEKNISSLSIVQQIDTVLQARMTDTPLAKRGIRLQESIQGGVEVYVGLKKFLAVDDVPDEEIKATIRAAIAEWEKKYTPGM
jgi:hypothetical protein